MSDEKPTKIDWRDKQLIEDIEKHNKDPLDVTLELLTFWNREIYGNPNDKNCKKNRKYWSTKIQVSYQLLLQLCECLLTTMIFFFFLFFRLLSAHDEQGTTTKLSWSAVLFPVSARSEKTNLSRRSRRKLDLG